MAQTTSMPSGRYREKNFGSLIMVAAETSVLERKPTRWVVLMAWFNLPQFVWLISGEFQKPSYQSYDATMEDASSIEPKWCWLIWKKVWCMIIHFFIYIHLNSAFGYVWRIYTRLKLRSFFHSRPPCQTEIFGPVGCIIVAQIIATVVREQARSREYHWDLEGFHARLKGF